MSDKIRSVDPATIEMLEKIGDMSTMFSRAEEMKPCTFGSEGSCCRVCAMGPCRLGGKSKDGREKTGVCGATIHTVAARNLARAVAAGASAHADHGRSVAMTFLAAAKGEAPGYSIKDEVKLMEVAKHFGIETEGKTVQEVGIAVGEAALSEYGKQENTPMAYVGRATQKRQKIWEELGVFPRSFDREVVQLMHQTHAGVDQDPEHILMSSIRTALADGWGGSMMATDLQDIMFGTPRPLRSEANLGILKEENVNIILHGHEPLLSEKIVDLATSPEMIEYAKSKGAQGITLGGICCTGNEVLMRRGVGPAGNVLQQELAITTGVVDSMIVDVQCVFQGVVAAAKNYHTKVITTNERAKITGAEHIQFDEHNAEETAKSIVMTAIDNFVNRKGDVFIPEHKKPMIAGFSHEYIKYMLGGKFRASFRPLNDAIISGRIQGAVAIVGCNNPRTPHDDSHRYLVEEFIKRDILVVMTGCAAQGAAKAGYMTPETMDKAGEGLKEICEAVGIPPVLHLGSCVDNSRVLTVLTEIVNEGGLGEDVNDLPAVGIAPEWYSEKALTIGLYAVATGAYVVFGGVQAPYRASSEMMRLTTEGFEEKFGAKFEFFPTKEEILEASLNHIQAKRKALGIDTQKERVLFDMEMRRELSV
ncbi:MAG TPA: anaerobic carbon-monoxide dehydrogenase catalytic subunit [Anaerolineae bacterium]|nr:anaerobic carbon-monoxide dehydrogenase catalytic subunit [Anaerolineae bacterium]